MAPHLALDKKVRRSVTIPGRRPGNDHRAQNRDGKAPVYSQNTHEQPIENLGQDIAGHTPKLRRAHNTFGWRLLRASVAQALSIGIAT